MVQGLFGGATSYEEQSLADIIEDIESWMSYAKDTMDFIDEGINESKKNAFWNMVPFNFQMMLFSTVKCQKTYIYDFEIILKCCREDNISEREVKLLKKIGVKAVENNCEYGRIYKEESNWKDYSNPKFRIVEKLYKEGRDFFVTLQDATNASNRLRDYMNKQQKVIHQNNVNQTIAGNGNQVLGINTGTVMFGNLLLSEFSSELATALVKINELSDITEVQKKYLEEILRDVEVAIRDDNQLKQAEIKSKFKGFIGGVGKVSIKVIDILSGLATIGTFLNL